MQDQSAQLKATGATVISVGVGNFDGAARQELQTMASNNSLVFTANDFSKLLPMLDEVTKATCDVGLQNSGSLSF